MGGGEEKDGGKKGKSLDFGEKGLYLNFYILLLSDFELGFFIILNK